VGWSKYNIISFKKLEDFGQIREGRRNGGNKDFHRQYYPLKMVLNTNNK
jgi:hypothetical protein